MVVLNGRRVTTTSVCMSSRLLAIFYLLGAAFCVCTLTPLPNRSLHCLWWASLRRMLCNKEVKERAQTDNKKIYIYSPGLEPRTFLTWGTRVNHYTTNLMFSVKEQLKWNARAIVVHPSTTFAYQLLTVFSWPDRGSFVMLCCIYLQILASHGPTMKRIIYIEDRWLLAANLRLQLVTIQQNRLYMKNPSTKK